MDNREKDLGRNRATVSPGAEDGLNRIGSPSASSLLGPGFWQMLNWSRGGVGLRLLAAVLLFSSIVTLTLTAASTLSRLRSRSQRHRDPAR